MRATQYGLWGTTRREFLTWRGRVLVHSNRAELEWLFPHSVVREVPPSFATNMRLPIQQHPDLQHVTFPLVRSEFR